MNIYAGKIGNGASQIVTAPLKNIGGHHSSVITANRDLRSGK